MLRVVLLVHGGCGSPQPGAQGEQARRHALAAALLEGRSLLAGGASALDAVERVVRRLESHALFNAGTGSVLNAAGEVQMEACIADGATGAAGGVCAVRRLAHPVSAARLVMQESRHVLLAGAGAESFALARGAEPAQPQALVTAERRAELAALREEPDAATQEVGGAVGAVARDGRGHLAAASSSGGRVDELPGRVGAGALLGLGCWARDATCAVSLSGGGESIVRAAVAHQVDALLRLRGLPLDGAARRALEPLAGLGGQGGLVAVDREGRFAAEFTTRAFYRGWIGARGAPVVKVFAGR